MSTGSASGRVLALVEHVASGGSTANLSDLARATGLNRVTATRLLADLEGEGVLERSGAGHRLGHRLLTLAATALSGEDLTSLGQRALDGLSTELGVSAYLVVPESDRVTYLLRALPDSPLVSRVTVGTSVPVDATTAGRAIVHAGDGRTGCVWSWSGYEVGIDSVAAPVVGPGGTALAAISLAAPSGVLDGTARRRAQVEAALHAAVTDLAALLASVRG